MIIKRLFLALALNQLFKADLQHFAKRKDIAYNSNLSKQAEQLRDLENEISDFERRQLQLEQYSEKLTAMMDWKEV